jgi:hypothetical protein
MLDQTLLFEATSVDEVNWLIKNGVDINRNLLVKPHCGNRVIMIMKLK